MTSIFLTLNTILSKKLSIIIVIRRYSNTFNYNTQYIYKNNNKIVLGKCEVYAYWYA